MQAEEGFYFIQNGTSNFLMQRFRDLIGEHTAQPQEVEVVMGRTLKVYPIIDKPVPLRKDLFRP